MTHSRTARPGWSWYSLTGDPFCRQIRSWACSHTSLWGPVENRLDTYLGCPGRCLDTDKGRRRCKFPIVGKCIWRILLKRLFYKVRLIQLVAFWFPEILVLIPRLRAYFEGFASLKRCCFRRLTRLRIWFRFLRLKVVQRLFDLAWESFFRNYVVWVEGCQWSNR